MRSLASLSRPLDFTVQLVDEKGSVWRHFDITEQSSFVLLDAQGDEVYRSGYGGGDDLEREVRGNGPRMTEELAVASAPGILAAVNPCGFALLPAYLSLLIIDQDVPTVGLAVRRALVSTAAMTLGFVAVFAVFGLVIAPLAAGGPALSAGDHGHRRRRAGDRRLLAAGRTLAPHPRLESARAASQPSAAGDGGIRRRRTPWPPSPAPSARSWLSSSAASGRARPRKA